MKIPKKNIFIGPFLTKLHPEIFLRKGFDSGFFLGIYDNFHNSYFTEHLRTPASKNFRYTLHKKQPIQYYYMGQTIQDWAK